MEWWILSSSALAAKSAMRIYVLDPTWEGLEHIKLKTTIYNTLNIIPGIGSSANLPHLAKTLLNSTKNNTTQFKFVIFRATGSLLSKGEEVVQQESRGKVHRLLLLQTEMSPKLLLIL